eukprot:TRINITY_DN48766_c0_g1_i1.p1 TRINITY_DN48766_c0_g1~~TRINITY_DN48766_c0_g1_i1.p1  ORF type:complete len:496 (-),score=39.58 TRINITY_DN48766_c0_g1_i1:138-1625(-)
MESLAMDDPASGADPLRPPLRRATTVCSDSSAREVLGLALRLAQIMSKSGACAKRNTDVIECFLTRLGVKDVFVHVHLTSVRISMKDPSGEWLMLAARMDHGVHFDALLRVTIFVRNLEADSSIKYIEQELDDMITPHYGKIATAVPVAISCVCICLLIGGDVWSVPVVFIAAMIGMLVRMVCAAHHVNVYLNWLITSYVAANISLLISTFCFRIETPIKAMLSPTLMLVPGVPIVNSVLDLVRTRSDTAIARLTFLVPLLLMQGHGMVLAAMQFGLVQSDDPEFREAAASNSIVRWPLWAHALADAALSSITALGFAILFQAPCQSLPYVCMVGWIGHAVKTVLVGFVKLCAYDSTLYTGVVEFIAVALMVLAAFGVERKTGTPGILFYVPGLVIMMPGASLLSSMLNFMWVLQEFEPKTWDTSNRHGISEAFMQGFALFLHALVIIGGLCLGVAVPSIIFHMSTSSVLQERYKTVRMLKDTEADVSTDESEDE